ncbi:hypothetical protein [Nocardia sp. CA-119907]|uniref:hypothetical protein n=1 Tax=Nocardia sp. CA-119907 TaxID=3239973 RepID=UPI003D99A961
MKPGLVDNLTTTTAFGPDPLDSAEEVESATTEPGHLPPRRWSRHAPGLAERFDQARERILLQHRPELYEVMDDREIDAEVRLHKRLRRKARRQRGRVFGAELAGQNRDRREAVRVRRDQERQRRWHARSRASRLRYTSADAQEATLHRKATWSSLRLRGVIAVGLVWSAINVGRNLAPTDGPTGASWWMLWILSFGIEAMISVPILEIMSQAATAARLRQQVERTRIIAFEATLLVATVSLNCGPHVAAGHFGRAAEYAVAPIMVVVLMWLHAWLMARYATLIDTVATSEHNSDITTDQSSDTDAYRHGPPSAGPDEARLSVPGTTAFDPAHISSPDAALRYLAPVTPSSHAAESVASHDLSATGTLVDDVADATPIVDVEPHDRYTRVAIEMVRTRASQKSVAHIVEILRLADHGLNANAVTAQMSRDTRTGWTRSTVDRIIKCADTIGFRTLNRQEVSVIARTA